MGRSLRFVQSSELETIWLPSGKNLMELTELVCPSNGLKTVSPDAVAQTWIVLLEEPETIHWLSGENATE